eukprot:UN10181
MIRKNESIGTESSTRDGSDEEEETSTHHVYKLSSPREIDGYDSTCSPTSCTSEQFGGSIWSQSTDCFDAGLPAGIALLTLRREVDFTVT